jgi:hypothetical protein
MAARRASVRRAVRRPRHRHARVGRGVTVGSRWLVAAERGLDDEPVLQSASALVALGCESLSSRAGTLSLTHERIDSTTDALERRIDDHSMRRRSA